MGTGSESLFRTLVNDVESALHRVTTADTEGHRREVVRTIFAAIEGMSWLYREHVRSAAHTASSLSSIADMALQEKTYSVSDTGHLAEQTRFVPLPAMIRFTTRVAQEAFQDFHADFSGQGWSKLKTALAMRNRLMHPKIPSDLTISLTDVDTAKQGFFWFCSLATRGMAAANVELIQFSLRARDLTEKLCRGDEKAMAAYREALSRED